MIKLFDTSEFLTAYNNKYRLKNSGEMNFLNTPKFALMQKSLDGMVQKINITAENIANAETPGYKAKRLDFESVLQNRVIDYNNSHALRMRYKWDSRYATKMIENAQPVVSYDNSAEKRIDGNNVDIDHENLELARVKIQYDYMTRKINDEYNLLKLAITEGKG